MKWVGVVTGVVAAAALVTRGGSGGVGSWHGGAAAAECRQFDDGADLEHCRGFDVEHDCSIDTEHGGTVNAGAEPGQRPLVYGR